MNQLLWRTDGCLIIFTNFMVMFKQKKKNKDTIMYYIPLLQNNFFYILFVYIKID